MSVSVDFDRIDSLQIHLQFRRQRAEGNARFPHGNAGGSRPGAGPIWQDDVSPGNIYRLAATA